MNGSIQSRNQSAVNYFEYNYLLHARFPQMNALDDLELQSKYKPKCSFFPRYAERHGGLFL